jgi:hypothetical protein
MVLVNTSPGRPKLLAGLPVQQRKIAFLSTLTAEQWKLAGGPGIGLADLTPDQQAMFDSLLLPRFRVRTEKIKAVEDDPTGRVRGADILEEKGYDRNAVRLRFQRETSFSFYEVGKQAAEHGGSLFQDPKIGDTVHTLDDTVRLEDAGSGGSDDTTAFGVPLRQTVASRLKPSELDYASPALNAYVPLTAEMKTVQDVLRAVSKQTGLELHADRRIASLPLFLRSAPNQGARAGDLLMALAWGITGAYRRMDAAVYLLTDDIEGIGARFARLAIWVGEAEGKKRQLLEKGIENAAKQNPLQHLSYPKNYPGALPGDLQQRIEEQWGKPDSVGAPVEFRTGELPSSVRAEMDEQIRGVRELWEEFDLEPVNLDTARVGISIELGIAYVMPDGTAVKMEGADIGDAFARLLTLSKTKKAPVSVPSALSASPATIKPLPANLARAVVLVPLPTPEEARRLMATVKRRGFTEVWIQIPLKGANRPDTAPLAAVIAAGKKTGIKVYAAVSLLRGEGIGVPERNLLGQDGDAAAEASIAYMQQVFGSPETPPGMFDFVRWDTQKLRGWIALSAAEQKARERQVLALAAVPGLAGITFRHTGVLGNTGEVQHGTRPNTEMGYTPTQRLAFLRQEGYDPLDLPGAFNAAELRHDLPFFPTSLFERRYRMVGNKGELDTSYVPAPTAWWRFREARNREMLTSIYSNVKRAYPSLALYIDDRTSSYTFTALSWYGSWDAADRLPRNLGGVESQEGTTVTIARKASKTTLLNFANLPAVTETTDGPTGFARAATFMAGEAVKGWNGLTVDLSELPFADALRLLEAIPAR